ncbi:uncharacterized protein LOC128882383 [Hylaeus volcanicus]|uniref:uncharacterized protein LOC128882383 n=1 Tax=Hylaeus volcanicus TaxID=313075 RepID=UPI0023B80898|nr:uncharacterized protein LOC128882383 [Hylaeus volcanicus]
MSMSSFDILVNLMREHGQMVDSRFRKTISIEERSTVTLRTQFPNCVGAVGGKHVRLMCPQHSGSYVNRKGYHSINVQLVSDPDLRIIHVNARFPGITDDNYILNNSNILAALKSINEYHGNGFYLLATLPIFDDTRMPRLDTPGRKGAASTHPGSDQEKGVYTNTLLGSTGWHYNFRRMPLGTPRRGSHKIRTSLYSSAGDRGPQGPRGGLMLPMQETSTKPRQPRGVPRMFWHNSQDTLAGVSSTTVHSGTRTKDPPFPEYLG